MIKPTVIYQDINEERKDSVLRYILNRVHASNKNFLAAITGATGSGKTYSGIYMAEQISKKTGVPFDETQIVFTFAEFMKLINSRDLPIGTPIVFDEPQISINARAWQSQANQSFNALVSTFRHRRLIVFFCTPYIDFLDKATRTLFHGEFRMQTINKTDKYAKVAPDFIEYSSHKEDFYHHWLKVVHRVAGKKKMVSSKLKTWKVPMATDELLKKYEIKKMAFTTALNKELEKKFEKVEVKDKVNVNHADKIEEAYKQFGDDVFLIAKHLNLAPVTARQHLTLYKKHLLKQENEEKLSPMMV
jgi:hypothetical protein